jgi:hypothetical protein
MTIDELLRMIRAGALPLHVAVQLSAPGALDRLWEHAIDPQESSFGIIDAVALLAVTWRHETELEYLRRLPDLHHSIVPRFTPPAWGGNEREWARAHVSNWLLRLSDVSGAVYPGGDAKVRLSRFLRPLGPPTLDEIVRAAERHNVGP